MGAARTLFAERGYADVAADEIVRAAGVTRGALYHHYTDKRGLFEEVFEQLETEITAEIAAAAAAAPDQLTALAAGVDCFLDICQRPEVLQIGLTDAPAVLGWAKWREIESRHGLGLTVDLLQDAADAGVLVPAAVPDLAQILLGAVIEAGLIIAHAQDREAAAGRARQTLALMTIGLIKTVP